MTNIKKILTAKWIDFLIWVLISILFIYELFIGGISTKIIWIIATILIFISLTIKLIFIRRQK